MDTKTWRGVLRVSIVCLILTGCQAIDPWQDRSTRRVEVIEAGEDAKDAERKEPEPEAAPRPSEQQRAKRQVAFPEEEYAALEKSGNASIAGRISLNTASGVKYGADTTISVAPVTTYSAEAAEMALAGKAVEPADPRAQAYTHRTRTDSRGYFELNGLPAGDFYVSGSIQPSPGARPRIIINQVSVGHGQTVRVDLTR
ncbi:carboxypeptidase-like regulatory domain-containing protein [Aidingimonas halophila]|uniref:carboxypeptidase-like regulatory domain-containing protein n=1 Tax=Aidingimonas halophila TaxID=574349 RepID=UPI001E60A290|nr:carboxypeptidase-like regulatory domain-containing protein [Aidingimonas halophila]